MNLCRKIKKAIWCVGNLNLAQSIYLNRRFQHPRSSFLHVYHHSILKIDPSAKLILPENSYFKLNALNIERSRDITTCLLWMSKGSEFTSYGLTMYEGAEIVLYDNAKLEIGKGTYMNKSTIECSTDIHIGKDCAIASNVLIMDTDYHTITDDKGIAHSNKAPIFIGDNVWICSNVTILKGVNIANDSVIAAGSVVVKDVPPHCVVAGNPAKVIKQNISWKL